jgi:F0F1-type ATP synthase assembly protein I
VNRVEPLPPHDSPDTRSPLAIAYEWASRIMVVSLEMVVPGLAGYGLDYWLGTKAVFVILGFILGMVLGVWHLMHMVGGQPGSSTRKVK